MDEKFLAGLLSEIIESQGVALGLLTTAIASQLDAQKLSSDLAAHIHAAKNQAAFPAAAEQISTHALEAALAVAKKQKPRTH